MEAYHRVLKSEGHMSPLLVAITHLNDLFMQNNLVAMVTVKHVTMCAEIFSDTWDWKKSQTASHGTATINANVRIFILWSVGAVATLLFTDTIITWFRTIKTFLERAEAAVCASLPIHCVCKSVPEVRWGNVWHIAVLLLRTASQSEPDLIWAQNLWRHLHHPQSARSQQNVGQTCIDHLAFSRTAWHKQM